MSQNSKPSLQVAIIGAGVIGLLLALALENRDISYIIYEQAESIPATGAGLNCNPAGIRALKYIGSEAYAAYKEVRTSHHRHNEQLYMTYTDGHNDFKVMCCEEFGSLHRVRFVEAILKRLPTGKIRLGKRVKRAEQVSSTESTTILFEDGSSASCDVVLGCDGLKSKVRSLIVGENHPSAKPCFSHIVGYRGLVDRTKAQQVLDPVVTEGAALYVSPGANFVSYPATDNILNLGLFMPHPEQWPHFPSVSHRVDKGELLKTLQTTHPNILKVAELLPDPLDVWAVYDTLDNPLPTYNRDYMALLGDGAHASSPNLGSGAGMGYEDVAVMAALLSDITNSQELSDEERPSTQSSSKSVNEDKAARDDGSQNIIRNRIKVALAAYTATRKDRTQWLPQASRYLGECYLMQAYDVSLDMKRFEKDVIDRYDYVWRESIIDMVNSARDTRDTLIAGAHLET